MTTTTLDNLAAGDTGTIVATSGQDAPLLRAMGLREGVEVTVKRTGEPCIVDAGHTRLGLARAMSGVVEVTTAS